VAKGFENKADLIFIDGDHTLAGVSQDLFSWKKHLTKGAIVVFHDRHLPAIKEFLNGKAVEQTLEKKEEYYSLSIWEKK
jgi:spermidine synthase